MSDFNQMLAFGKLGESAIAEWLNKRGWNVLPVYEKQIDEGKGPQLFTPMGQLIAPDLFAFKPLDSKSLWIEAKHKSVFSWHRKTRRWVTGIDLMHYGDYLKIDTLSPWPIWLLFLHVQSSIPERDEPWPCPVGLFGQTINELKQKENHRHSNWGKTGMVYWWEKNLVRLASLDELILSATRP